MEDVKDLQPNELRELLAGFMEEEYLLIDVRQPEEYALGHLPGALHVPLMELDAAMPKIAQVEHKIFYCLLGGRSLHASFMAAQVHGLTNVYNLLGGLLAWDGHIVANLPRLKVFERSETFNQILLMGMNLEKGAELFYQQLLGFFEGTKLTDAFTHLADAESVHARLLYEHLDAETRGQWGTFEKLFSRLSGDLLESGESTDSALARAKDLEEVGAIAVLELALGMELEAHDLYRTLATQADTLTVKNAFLDLATHENFHAQAVAALIGRVAER